MAGLTMKFQKFTTLEIVLMAVLAVANAVITMYLSLANKALTALGGPIATSTIVGLYMIYGLLAVYIIRKPGTALLTYLMGGIIQGLLGNAYGIAASIVAALSYAAALELVFALTRYKRWDRFTMAIAGCAMVPLWFVFAAYMFGYIEWGAKLLIVTFVVRCVSGTLLCGLLCKWLGDMMARTGLLRSFAVSKDGK